MGPRPAPRGMPRQSASRPFKLIPGQCWWQHAAGRHLQRPHGCIASHVHEQAVADSQIWGWMGRRQGRTYRSHARDLLSQNQTLAETLSDGTDAFRGNEKQQRGEQSKQWTLKRKARMPPAGWWRAAAQGRAALAKQPAGSQRHQEALLVRPLPQDAAALQPGGGHHPLAHLPRRQHLRRAARGRSHAAGGGR